MARKNTINLPAGLHFCRNIVTLYSMCGFAKHIVTCVASVVLALCLADALGMYDCRYEPVAEPEIEKPAETVRRARLLFAGDVMCHMPQVIAARSDSGYDFKGSFAGVKPYFDRADMAIVNLETTVSSNGRYSGYPSFSSPPELIDALHWLGVDVALLANNHCCDRGRRGISSTIDKLDGCRIAHTGVFRSPEEYSSTNPLRFEIDSISFAMLNYTYGTNGLEIPDGYKVNLTDTLALKTDLAKGTKTRAPPAPPCGLSAGQRRRRDCRKPPACGPAGRDQRRRPSGTLLSRQLHIQPAETLLRRRYNCGNRCRKEGFAACGIPGYGHAGMGHAARLPPCATGVGRHGDDDAIATCRVRDIHEGHRVDLLTERCITGTDSGIKIYNRHFAC